MKKQNYPRLTEHIQKTFSFNKGLKEDTFLNIEPLIHFRNSVVADQFLLE